MKKCLTGGRRIILGLTLLWSSAKCGYSQPLTSSFSVQQRETAMSFIIWAVIGLTAGFVGSQLEMRSRRRSITDLLLGLSGAMAGGYVYYRFGPVSVNGLHVVSYLAATIGALVFMLSLYAFRRL